MAMTLDRMETVLRSLGYTPLQATIDGKVWRAWGKPDLGDIETMLRSLGYTPLQTTIDGKVWRAWGKPEE